MTYHRTSGTGGNARQRDQQPPNFNKSTTGGHTKKPSPGKRKAPRSR